MRRIMIGWVLLLGVSQAIATDPVEALLAHVDDDAAVVVVVPSLEGLVKGCVAFGEASGFEDVDLSTDELLNDLEVGSAVDNIDAIDRSGPLVVFLRPELDSPIAVLALKADVNVTAADRARVEGRVLICAPGGETLGAAAESQGRFAGVFSSTVGQIKPEHAALVYVDMPKLEETCDEMFAMAEGMSAMIAMTPQAAGAGPMIQWMLEAARTLTTESEWVVATLQIDAKGVHIRKNVRIEADGTIAEYLHKVRKSDEDVLRGLRGGNALMVYAAEWKTPPEVETISEMAARAMLKTLDSESEEYREISESFGVYRRIAGWNGLVTSDADQKMLIHGTILADKPQSLIADLTKLAELSSTWAGAMGTGITIDSQVSTETIGSVEARAHHMTMMSDDEAMQRMIDAIYGAAFWTFYFGDDQGVRIIGGRADAARAAVEGVLRDDGDPIGDDPRVAQALAALSDKPQGLILVDIPRMVGMLVGPVFEGQPDAPQLTAPTGPTAFIAGSLYLDKREIGLELWVPSEAVRAIAAMSE